MRFECQPGCIACCEQPGFIYITTEDLARISGHLGITQAEFRRKYLCGVAPLLRFRKLRRKQCPFLSKTGCEVHAVKPLQCSSFPFWPELLAKASQRKAAAKYCPGMNRGALVNIEKAQEIAGEVEKAFPGLYVE